MKFKIDGRELEAPETLRIGDVCEAEKLLGVSMEGGFGPKMAVMLFIAMRKDNPKKPPVLVADEVMRADIATMEDVEEAEEESPPAEAAGAADENGHANPLISGPQPSVP